MLLGDLNAREADGGNMKKIKFYVCPNCGNVITSTTEAEICCCGRKLSPLKPAPSDSAHLLKVQTVENDFYLTSPHEMSKQHYLRFIAYVCCDRVLLVQLYPEQSGEVRFPRMYGGKLFCCCSRDGLWVAARSDPVLLGSELYFLKSEKNCVFPKNPVILNNRITLERAKNMSVQTPLILLQHVFKSYHEGTENEVHALHDVSFRVQEGEFVSIIGQSGSGKSTLMNCIGCLDLPTSGTYQFRGIGMEHCRDSFLSRVRNREIGFIFQGFNLIAGLTAEENVEMPLVYRGLSGSERQKACP